MKTRKSHMRSLPNPHFTIAIVEHDEGMREGMATWVAEMGYAQVSFATAKELLSSPEITNFSLFLLDCEMPDMAGIDLLQQLRSDARIEAPVILSTVRGGEVQVADAFIGADDFIVKPARRSELTARVRVTLRRAYPTPADSGLLSVPPYTIDLANRAIHADGRPIELQSREFALAVMLFRNLNGVVSRLRINQSIWGSELTENSRSLDTHISRVRRKLGLTPERGLILQSVYGLGYRLQTVAALPTSHR